MMLLSETCDGIYGSPWQVIPLVVLAVIGFAAVLLLVGWLLAVIIEYVFGW